MKHHWLLVLLFCASTFPSFAIPIVRIRLQVDPVTHSFTCRYQFILPASDTTSLVRLNLSQALALQRVRSPHARQQQVSKLSYAGDTVRQVQVRYAAGTRRQRQIELTYSGTIAKGEFTDHVAVFSGHSNWLPFRPYAEYELELVDSLGNLCQMYRHELSERKWLAIEPYTRGHLSRGRANRLFVTAVIYRVCTGIAWRDLPDRFGPWNTVARRFRRWALAGAWERIFQAVQTPDYAWVLVDPTTVKAHKAAAGQKKAPLRPRP